MGQGNGGKRYIRSSWLSACEEEDRSERGGSGWACGRYTRDGALESQMSQLKIGTQMNVIRPVLSFSEEVLE